MPSRGQPAPEVVPNPFRIVGLQPALNIGMKIKLLALTLLAGSTVFAQVSLGIRIGPPPPPRIVRVHPISPGEGYVWVEGYQYPVGNRYRWHDGYWTRPPYQGAVWVSPRHDGERFYEGRWEGERGPIYHDHHSDHNGYRDYHRD